MSKQDFESRPAANMLRAHTKAKTHEVPDAMARDLELYPHGVALYVLVQTLPDSFNITLAGLRAYCSRGGRSAFGAKTLRQSIQLLEQKGWLIRGRFREEGGRLGSETCYFFLDDRTVYDACLEYMEELGMYVITERPAVVDELDGNAVSVVIDGMVHDRIDLAPKADNSFSTEEVTAGHDQGVKFVTLGLTWENDEITKNMVDNHVENDGKVGVQHVETENAQPAGYRGISPSLPRSEPKCQKTNVGFRPTNIPLVINHLETNQINYPSVHPTYQSGLARADESPQPDGAPGSLPDATNGRTDGRTKNDLGAQRADVPDAAAPSSPEPDRAAPGHSPGVKAAVTSMIAQSVNRNRLSTAPDREAMRIRVEEIERAGFAPGEIVAAWQKQLNACEAEGRAPRFYPQLLRWLQDDALNLLEQSRPRRNRPCDRAASGQADERLVQAVRFSALYDRDEEFARLVDEKRVREQEWKFGCCTAEAAQEARDAVQRYFDENADEVA